MPQLSFFSAESESPAQSDLAGLLAAQGQAVVRGESARISVVVDADWRAAAIAELIEQCGLRAEYLRTEEGRPLVRTESARSLRGLAVEWTKGAVKTVPPGWSPDPRALRAWVLAAGRNESGHHLLGLDQHATDTYEPLASAMRHVGVAPTLIGIRGGGPALRVSGRRRLVRLREYVGEAPVDAPRGQCWPEA